MFLALIKTRTFPPLIIPPDDTALWSIRLRREQARSLLADLEALANPPRAAAQLDPSGDLLTLYLWPAYGSDTGLALLLLDYGAARLRSTRSIEYVPGSVWVTGRLLWRLLRPAGEVTYAGR